MKVTTVKKISKYSIIVAIVINLIALSYYYGAVKPRTEMAAKAMYDQRDFKGGIDFIYEEMGDLIKENQYLDSLLISGEKIVLPYDLYPGVKKQIDAKLAESGIWGLTTMKERMNTNDSLKIREFECVGIGSYSSLGSFVKGLELSGIAITVEEITVSPFSQGLLQPRVAFSLRGSLPYTDILLRDSILYKKQRKPLPGKTINDISFTENDGWTTKGIELNRIKKAAFRDDKGIVTDEFGREFSLSAGAQVKNGFFIGADTEKEILRFFLITNYNPLSYSIVVMPYKSSVTSVSN